MMNETCVQVLLTVPTCTQQHLMTPHNCWRPEPRSQTPLVNGWIHKNMKIWHAVLVTFFISEMKFLAQWINMYNDYFFKKNIMIINVKEFINTFYFEILFISCITHIHTCTYAQALKHKQIQAERKGRQNREMAAFLKMS